MRILILFILILAVTTANSQTLTGWVSDPVNKPINGATITYVKKKAHVVSKADGKFRLDGFSLGDSILVSHMGFKSLYVIIHQLSDVQITLQREARELEEVIISTGYQRLPSERATGSFTQIDNTLLNEQVGTNVLERLKYISNGVTYFPNRVQTSAGDQLLVRGLSTLTMSIQKPLIIVDNFEWQGELNNINPNDVENITFLKDAAAGSIWGAKAANGVIVITTKKGSYQQPVQVELNTNITHIEKPNLYYLQDISPSHLVDVEKYLFEQGYRFSDTLSLAHTPFSPVYEILFKQRNGLLTEAEATAQLNTLLNHDVRSDFLKYLYQRALHQQYAVNARGGSDKIAWILSAGFDKNSSELAASYNRSTFRIDHSYRLIRNMEINTSVFYTESRSVSGKPDYRSIQTATGNIPIYTMLADKEEVPLPLYTRHRQGYIDTLGGGHLLDWRYYPLTDYKYNRQRGRLTDLNAAIGIRYNMLSGLNIEMKYRYSNQRINNTTLYDENSYYARDFINGYSNIDYSTGVVKYIIPKGSILDQVSNAIQAQNIRLQANFSRQWNQHQVTAIAGAEISETKNQGNSYRTYGYNPEILTFVNVDHTTTYPHFISGGSIIPSGIGFSKTNTRFASFYANGAYTLKKKYTVTGSMRRDASNLFGVNLQDKWKPLWSIGGLWDISKERFYTLEKIPTLKLRISYGHQGNIDPSKVGTTTFNYQATNPYTGAPYGQVRNYLNPDLRWEQVAMFNTGIEFATLGNRISGSIEYYNKRVTDMYGPSPIDVTAGIGSTIIKNVGQMKGNGMDISISSININRSFKWKTTIIFNTYKDKVIKYYNDSSFTASQIVNFGLGLEGYSTFSLFVYRWAGLDDTTGDPQGYINGTTNKDWLAITGTGSTKEDIKYVGSRIPTLFGSLGNTFEWKGLSLTARITYKFNYHFLRQSISYSSLVANLQGHSDYANRWQKPGDEKSTTVPSFVYPSNSARDAFYRNSEVLVEKGDHIRLQYVNLSYSLAMNSQSKLPVSAIQVYIVANNLGVIWKASKAGIDPDYSSIPPAKSYSMGIKIHF